LVNKYVKDAVKVGEPVRVAHLTERPILHWRKPGCLATAEGGEFSTARLLRPGRVVLVACDEPQDCAATRWTVVAEIESASEDSHPVLISRRRPCPASHSLTVVGFGR
jgi:hypothetical protein